MQSIEILEKLVSFPTVSKDSNLELIEFVDVYLSEHGISSTRVPNKKGTKANLYATIGPMEEGGIILSGHTDVVPVEGQPWKTDPFVLTEKGERLYGRGTCDMKAYAAIALALVPEMKNLKKPIHLAFSYDEEIGCIGVRRLIDKLNGMPIKPAMCIVGEPTSMQVITGHKGKRSYIGHVHGFEAHSSLAPDGVNAIEFAARFIANLRAIAERFQSDGPHDELYDVSHTTVHTGVISGGTQLNIVPKDCRFEFEFRYIGIQDPSEFEEEIRAYARDELKQQKSRVSYDKRDKAGAVYWRIECHIER